ncbi:hypothetical protein SAY86_011105 [Trapa natans]|uniref:Uncharacterized protein n=1 Tax=Trapa natans TaxID=22666 RepID=A0AAN7LIB2_TRANT|nr:hypothetical protein SAY86_011105 [Trapa natans]
MIMLLAGKIPSILAFFKSIICRFERSEISSLESAEGGSNSDLEIDGNTQKLINLLKRFHAEKKKRGKTLEKPMKARMQKHENWQKGSLGMLRDKLKSRIADLDASNSLLSLAKGF